MATPRLLGRVHVLVVDEDAEARDQIGRIVIDQGGIVTAVSSAERAAEFTRILRPTVIISDLRLGSGKSGVWLLDYVRSGPLATLPVIAVSREAGDDMLAAALPFSGYLTKPVDAHELCAAILGAVDRRAAAAPRIGAAD